MKYKLTAGTLTGLLGLLNYLLVPAAQAAGPTVTTLAATSITATNATLNGSVNPNGAATTVYFQYGVTANYGYLGAFAVTPAANTTQTLPGLVVSALPGAAGADWTQTSTNTGWTGIASSADGTRLAAVVDGGGIYTSTNSGGTWTQSSAPAGPWISIASSADGTRLAAAIDAGNIYTSTNGGVTWTQTSAPADRWQIASSASGEQLTAAATRIGGGIWTSPDGGVTWTLTSAPTDSASTYNYWNCLASSADGTRLAAGEYNDGDIWTSTNSGGTWTQASAPEEEWNSMAASADGLRLAASTYYGGGIWTSTDGGVTWTQSGAPGEDWSAITSAADGTQLAAVVDESGIWTSAGTMSSNLAPGTLYHYRLAGMNSAGISLGNDLTFTTLPTGGVFTEGDSLSARALNSDTAASNAVLAVDFVVASPGSLQSILTWGQNSGVGIAGVGQTFYAYVLRPAGTNFQVMLETGPLTVTSVGTNLFAAPPFNLQAGDVIAHYGRGIPFSSGTGGPSSVYYNNGLPLPMPSVGQLLQLPGSTYPLLNDGGRNYAIAVVVSGVPDLAITPSGNSVRLSWPANGASTLLQTTNLASGLWTTNAIFTSTSGTNSVVIAPSAGHLFFKLRSP